MPNRKKDPDSLHKCYICKEVYPRHAFPKKKDGSLHGECAYCRSEPGRKRRLKVKFGVDEEWYGKKFAEQNGLCAICHLPDPTGRRLSIDHNHETNEVRDLLCNLCNTAIGLLREDPTRLMSAIQYLAKWGKV